MPYYEGVRQITDFHDDVGRGLFSPDKELWTKFGYNSDVDAAAEEVLAEFGAAAASWVPPTTNETLDIVSGSAQDGAGGSGILTIKITGVDVNGDKAEETVTMLGLSTATTNTQFRGVNRVSALTFGSSGVAAGNIDITGTSSGDTYARIVAGGSVTQQMIFYTADEHTFLLTHVFLSVLKIAAGTTPTCVIRLIKYSFDSGGFFELFRWNVDTAIENTLVYNYDIPTKIEQNACIYLVVDTDTNDTEASARFAGVLYDDRSIL